MEKMMDNFFYPWIKSMYLDDRWHKLTKQKCEVSKIIERYTYYILELTRIIERIYPSKDDTDWL